MDGARFRELAIEHLLGTLEESERREFQAELERRGPDGEREIGRLSEAIGSLAFTAPPVEPAEGLRARLLAELRKEAEATQEEPRGEAPESAPAAEHAPPEEPRTEPGEPPGQPGEPQEPAAEPQEPPAEPEEPPAEPEEPAAEPQAPSADAAEPPAERAPREGTVIVPLRRWAENWGMAAAGIAAALAFVFSLINVGLRNRIASVEASLDSAQSALAIAGAELATVDSLRRELEGSQSALGVVGSRGSSTVMLDGTEEQPQAWARVFVDPVTGRALLMVRDLPILPADTVYQLWAIRGATPLPAGTLTVGEDGSGQLSSDDALFWLTADVLAVTIEPAPGSPAPTGPIVLAGEL